MVPRMPTLPPFTNSERNWLPFTTKSRSPFMIVPELKMPRRGLKPCARSPAGITTRQTRKAIFLAIEMDMVSLPKLDLYACDELKIAGCSPSGEGVKGAVGGCTDVTPGLCCCWRGSYWFGAISSVKQH